MMLTGAEFGSSLLAIIQSKDALKSYSQIQQLKESMKSTVHGAEYVGWISEPKNLTEIHAAITEHLGVPHRSMSIKRAQMTRTQRAVLLVQAMELAIKKVHKL